MRRALSLKDIERRIRELRAEAERLERTEKPGISELRTVLTKFKLGLPDVRIALNSQRGRKSSLKGRKVKPKYRNPRNRSETWAGRGRTPLWMAALIKKGKKRDDFLIKTL